MKIIFTFLLVVTTLLVFGQDNKTVMLQWKIARDEKLVYGTIMTETDSSTVAMNLGGLFPSMPDSSKKDFKAGKDFLNKFSQSLKNQDCVSTLTSKGNGVVDIVMTTKPKDGKESRTDTAGVKGKDIFTSLQSMNQGVMLRGSVYATGGIHSFWIRSSQKNLVSLLFELPARRVKIGDKWSLDVSLIGNDQNFVCDTSYKINEVTLTDIKNIQGETIAVLKYNITEYVKGNFNSPFFMGKEGGQKETMMKFVHQAVAGFSVDKGRWVSYSGVMNLVATGFMTVNKTTSFSLVAEKNAAY